MPTSFHWKSMLRSRITNRLDTIARDVISFPLFAAIKGTLELRDMSFWFCINFHRLCPPAQSSLKRFPLLKLPSSAKTIRSYVEEKVSTSAPLLISSPSKWYESVRRGKFAKLHEPFMGQKHSSYAKINIKGGKAYGKKGGRAQEYTALLTLPLDIQSLIRAKTIEAGASTFEKGAHGAKHLADIFKKAPGEGTPSVQVSNVNIAAFFHNKNCVELLVTFLRGVEVAAYVLEVLGENELKKVGIRIADELTAQTGLDAPEKFATHVHHYIRLETNRVYEDGLRHIYFLFHPDTNWHPEFQSLVRRMPLPENLLGMSECLDSLVVWMKFIRSYLNRVKPQKPMEIMFHVIIPAYEVTVINDPLEFPDLGPLMIHGETRRQQPYVWLNLPTIHDYPGRRLTLKNVGNMARPESEWKDAATIATGVGVFSAATAACVGTCILCPPAGIVAVLAWPFAAGGGAACAAETVEKRLSKQVPRILGTSDLNKDGAGTDEEDSEDSDDSDEVRTTASIVYQPETKHVSRHKHRHRHRRYRHSRS